MSIFMMKVLTQCPFCNKSHEVEIDFEDFLAWKEGESIQNVAPYLSANEREMLISGICPDCWDETFDEDEDDDYYEPDDLEEGFDPYEGCYTYDC